jgi:hypothetical protein
VKSGVIGGKDVLAPNSIHERIDFCNLVNRT